MMVSNELLMFQKMGEGFKEFVHYSTYIGGRFNHVATRTTCFVPMWPKPTGMSNNLRIMVMPCRILKTCLQCNFLSLAETNSILPILNDSHH